jgi:ribosomal protein S12 methylthiotransferase
MSNSPRSVALVSLGCPKNLVDSEVLSGHLASAGVLVGAPMDEADVIVINTCGFLQAARAESLEVIAEAVALKQSGSARRIVVAGCLVNRDGEALLRVQPGIDAVVSVNDRDAIVEAVCSGEHVSFISAAGPVGSDRGRLRLTPRHTAYLRIAEGCDQKCTYCTIPSIRGPLRSKPLPALLDEARDLIADGAIELNVIAQDTTTYGRDLRDADVTDAATLLKALDGLDGAGWIRLLYAYPNSFTDELIKVMASSDHILPYVDMPLQHINDTVLRRMGRQVTRDEIETLLDKLREAMEGIAIRTTFIVGFPGETDAQFSELLEFVQEFEFDAMGAFAYSPEEGTPAATMDDQVPDDVKAARIEQIMLAQQTIAFAANAAAVGQEVDVLVDGTDNAGTCIARHAGQAPEVDSVCLLTEPVPAGSVVVATIVDWQDYDLIAQPILNESTTS